MGMTGLGPATNGMVCLSIRLWLVPYCTGASTAYNRLPIRYG